jgi:hypothetical protein
MAGMVIIPGNFQGTASFKNEMASLASKIFRKIYIKELNL